MQNDCPVVLEVSEVMILFRSVAINPFVGGIDSWIRKQSPNEVTGEDQDWSSSMDRILPLTFD